MNIDPPASVGSNLFNPWPIYFEKHMCMHAYMHVHAIKFVCSFGFLNLISLFKELDMKIYGRSYNLHALICGPNISS
jgi:hypothetical protein